MDPLAPRQIGDGPGNLEDTVVGAGGEAEPVGDQLQRPVAGSIQFVVFPEVTGVRDWR